MITATHLLNTTVSVERREAATDDGIGGQTSEWVIVGVLPARISQPTDDEMRVALAEDRRLTHRVYFAPGADVWRGDQIVTAEGVVLFVTAVVEPSEPAYLRAMCAATQAGF